MSREWPVYATVLHYPAIDNHAHPLLKSTHRDALPFEGVISEADGDALTQDSPNTLACIRATRQLGELLHLPADATWGEVKAKRETIEYVELCKTCFEPSNIHCLLLDDGLGSSEMVEELGWHDQFTNSKSWRIVRIETEAEILLKKIVIAATYYGASRWDRYCQQFVKEFEDALLKLAQSAQARVIAFKSIICYRTGLNVSLTDTQESILEAFIEVAESYMSTGKMRLQHKVLNDYLLRIALGVCQRTGKPIQFHTGLGDSDITLSLASPAHLQPLIKAYPEVKFVLLHASYPYTREAGYLTAVYSNVFLDFGEVFPTLSRQGQMSVLQQVFELCPTNKIMWSSDGHYWPETYYLAARQAREVLSETLRNLVREGDLTLEQAVEITQAALFKNANRIYALGLEEPELKIFNF
ncbi:hypothetical protein AX17_002256 [Amanita inopinata Kibby_2008]|nr:hypothetical protein AX17_002256 [Amanita inopinata Kibby_2008]